MELTRRETLEKLLSAYSHYYDITREVPVGGRVFPAFAAFHLRDESYLLSRRHVLSAVEQHEYVYFYLTERLTAAELEELIALTREDGLQKIHPHKEHMASYVTLSLLAEWVDPEAQELLRRTRFRKNFRFSFHGWMEYRIAAMEAGTGRFFSNPAGRATRKTLEANLGNMKKAGGKIK